MEQELVPSANPMSSSVTIAEDGAVTSCPVLKLFTGQMAGNDVTRLRVDCLANAPFPLSPDHLVQLCVL